MAYLYSDSDSNQIPFSVLCSWDRNLNPILFNMKSSAYYNIAIDTRVWQCQ